MFLILNRLRGTQGLWSKIIGLLLALATLIAFHNTYVALAVGLGYIVGESFGWGLWVGSLSERADGHSLYAKGEREGANNGIEWIASHIVKPTQESWLNYCRVALTIRGFYWWLPTLAPLYFVGFSVVSITVAVAVLSIGFPIACELGRLTSPLFSFEYKTFSVKGGLEHQEVWYGLMQDMVLLSLFILI